MHTSLALAIAAMPAAAFAVQTINRLAGKGLTFGRMDPVVQPGGLSGHTHAVFGGDKFAVSMDDDVATTSTCASSLVKGDGSNYWSPLLYFSDGKTFESVPVFYSNVYYKFEPADASDKIVPFAKGFRMASGDPTQRSPPAAGPGLVTDKSQGTPQPVEITCPTNDTLGDMWPKGSDGTKGVGIPMPGASPVGAGVGFPNQYCDIGGAPMRLDIHFPSCYNPAAGPDNYKENTDWPTNGKCPDGWDHIPHLFYEIYYDTPKFNSRWTPGQNSQPFLLATGDTTGYGLHGDFLNGWDPDVLTKIIGCDNGDNGGGSIDTCPGLTPDMVYSQDEANACTIPAYNPINEPILGTMSELPGCNPTVGYGSKVNMATSCSKDAGYAATGMPGMGGMGGNATGMPTAAPTGMPSGSQSGVPSGMPSGGQSRPSYTLPGGAGGMPTSTSGTVVAAGASATMVPPGRNPGGPMQPATTSSTSLATGGGQPPNSMPTGASPPSSGSPGSPGSVGGSGGSGGSNGSNTQCSPPPQGWTALGCFSDSKDQRVLSGATTNMLQSMTIPQCTDYCSQKGYAYAGLEWKSECYCGHEAPTETSDQCTDHCVGDTNTFCGGWNAINVYATQGGQKRDVHRHVRRHRRFPRHGAREE